MVVLRKMRAVAGALLLSPGLGMASDSGTAASNPQTTPMQTASEDPQALQARLQAMQAMQAQLAMQAMMQSAQVWPQMMPMGGAPAYYPATPPGMMWPMQQQWPAPMVMPPVQAVPWMPVMWVLVPVPAEIPGSAEVSYGPVAATPVVKLAPIVPTPAPSGAAALASGVADTKVDPGTPPRLPASLTVQAVQPDSEPVVNYGPVSPVPVIKLPVPEMAPVKTPDAAATPAPGAAMTGKSGPAPVVHAVEAVLPPSVGSLAAPAVAVESAPLVPIVDSPSRVNVDYGPVAPTPVVELLTLIQPASPDVRKPATTKRARKSSVSIPLKPRSRVTAKPAKQRMCWTKGVVAPCR